MPRLKGTLATIELAGTKSACCSMSIKLIEGSIRLKGEEMLLQVPSLAAPASSLVTGLSSLQKSLVSLQEGLNTTPSIVLI